MQLSVIDELLPEPPGGAHEDAAAAAEALRAALLRHLAELDSVEPDELRRARHCKYDRMGEWRDVNETAP